MECGWWVLVGGVGRRSCGGVEEEEVVENTVIVKVEGVVMVKEKGRRGKFW